ncbi:MAG: amino acid permease [Bdellovibrionales bacterium]|nr:amino acid permease [Bdellovibrionales bacterium]
MSAEPQLLRRVAGTTAIAIVIGEMIGSGIFKKPGLMAGHLGNPTALLLAWVIAGVVTTFGALTNAEVASMYPRTGGQYVFFREIYGRFFAFLYGWALFSVVQTASIASIAYVSAEYLQVLIPFGRLSPEVEQSLILTLPGVGTFFPLENLGVKCATLAIIFVLAAINWRGIKAGSQVAKVMTIVKLLAIVGIVALAFFGGGRADTSASGLAQGLGGGEITPLGMIQFGAWAAALSGAFWAYDGWNSVTFLAGEIENPQRNLPRALIVGTAVVTGVYFIVVSGYLNVLSVGEMAQTKLVAATVIHKIIGGVGVLVVSFFIFMSAFGGANGTTMTSPRVYYAMAKDGLFFSAFQKVHPKYHSPWVAILAQTVLASIYVITGTFDQLTDMLIFVSWLFYASMAFGVFVLRRTRPHEPRPYRVIGYPVVPVIFILVSLFYLGVTLYDDARAFTAGEKPVMNAVLGLIILALGVPIYFYFRKSQGSKGT